MWIFKNLIYKGSETFCVAALPRLLGKLSNIRCLPFTPAWPDPTFVQLGRGERDSNPVTYLWAVNAGCWAASLRSCADFLSLSISIAFSSPYFLLPCYLQGASFCHLPAILFRWGKGRTSFLLWQGLLKQYKLQTLHRMHPLFNLLLCFSLMIALPQVPFVCNSELCISNW